MRLRSSWNHLSKILGRQGTEYIVYREQGFQKCPALKKTLATPYIEQEQRVTFSQKPRPAGDRLPGYIGNKDFGIRRRSSYQKLLIPRKYTGFSETSLGKYTGFSEKSRPADKGDAIYRTRVKRTSYSQMTNLDQTSLSAKSSSRTVPRFSRPAGDKSPVLYREQEYTGFSTDFSAGRGHTTRVI